MAGKKNPKGKAPMRRVSIADDDGSPVSRPATPGPSNFSRHTTQGSPATSHVSSPSESRSRRSQDATQPATSASVSSPPAPAPASTTGSQVPSNRYNALPTPVPQQYPKWRPPFNFGGGPVATFGAVPGHFAMATLQPAAPMPAPPTDNPPDEMGPPPPPPPPPAIPPVVNPHGVHFQPQVPGTEQGPMVHRYTPRQDPAYHPGMFFTGPQMSGYMANGAAVPMVPVNVAAATAPVHPIVLQQPVGPAAMLANNSVQGGPPLMIPGPAQAIHVQGNPALLAGPSAQRPPIHIPPINVEPAMGVGLTPNETIAENIRIAQNNKAYEPQDFKPADPDPYRMYWFRELDGHWAVFPRRQIDRLCARWYRTDDGVFYAVRLAE